LVTHELSPELHSAPTLQTIEAAQKERPELAIFHIDTFNERRGNFRDTIRRISI